MNSFSDVIREYPEQVGYLKLRHPYGCGPSVVNTPISLIVIIPLLIMLPIDWFYIRGTSTYIVCECCNILIKFKVCNLSVNLVFNLRMPKNTAYAFYWHTVTQSTDWRTNVSRNEMGYSYRCCHSFIICFSLLFMPELLKGQQAIVFAKRNIFSIILRNGMSQQPYLKWDACFLSGSSHPFMTTDSMMFSIVRFLMSVNEIPVKQLNWKCHGQSERWGFVNLWLIRMQFFIGEKFRSFDIGLYMELGK